MAFLFGVVYVLIEGPAMGWTDARNIAVGVVALLAFVAFLRYESRRRDPSSTFVSSAASRSRRRR